MHDFENRATLISALEGVDGHLILDLTRCAFVDKFLIGVVLGKALELSKRGIR